MFLLFQNRHATLILLFIPFSATHSFQEDFIMYYFIVNPVSRSGQGMEVWKQTKKELHRKNLSYKVYFTKYSGHGKQLAKNISQKASRDILAVIGGDGTMNEVLNGISSDSTVTLSYIPVGSGNDFARGMNLPNQPDAALAGILSASPETVIDTGYLKTLKHTSRFAISSGLGYDAEVCYEVSHSRVKKWLNRIHLGKLIYAYAAVKLLFTFQPSDMEVELDGNKHYQFTKVYFVVGMNLPYEGGGFRFCPNADCKDGELDYMIVHDLSKLLILFLFPTAYFALHTKIPGITILRGKEMRIHSQRPYKIHLDGEFAGISDTMILGVNEQSLHFK